MGRLATNEMRRGRGLTVPSQKTKTRLPIMYYVIVHSVLTYFTTSTSLTLLYCIPVDPGYQSTLASVPGYPSCFQLILNLLWPCPSVHGCLMPILQPTLVQQRQSSLTYMPLQHVVLHHHGSPRNPEKYIFYFTTYGSRVIGLNVKWAVIAPP